MILRLDTLSIFCYPSACLSLSSFLFLRVPTFSLNLLFLLFLFFYSFEIFHTLPVSLPSFYFIMSLIGVNEILFAHNQLFYYLPKASGTKYDLHGTLSWFKLCNKCAKSLFASDFCGSCCLNTKRLSRVQLWAAKWNFEYQECRQRTSCKQSCN